MSRCTRLAVDPVARAALCDFVDRLVPRQRLPPHLGFEFRCVELALFFSLVVRVNASFGHVALQYINI